MTPEVHAEAPRPSPRSGLGLVRGLLGLALAVKMALAIGWLTGGDAALARAREVPEAAADAHPALAPVAVTRRQLAPPAGHREARALLESLAARQAELEKRELELTAREDRLTLYTEDLTEKISYLESLEKEIAGESQAMEEADSEAASSLAKVYAAMKPDDAAPLLDRLDDETVLRILAHMRAKQIGELLPLLDRDKAIVLTQALAGGG